MSYPLRRALALVAMIVATASHSQGVVSNFFGVGERDAYKLYQQAEAGDQVANAKLYNLAKDGNEWASLHLGYLIERGKGYVAIGAEGKKLQLQPSALITDPKIRAIEAGRHYAMVARKNLYASYNLALIYLKGLATPADVNDSQEDAEERDLLVRDKNGDSNKADPLQAGIRYMLMAAEKSRKQFPHPYMQLASIYENGLRSIGKNDGLAADYYEVAASLKDAQAQFKLGMIFLYGKGRPQDITAARLWLGKAAEQWNRNAMLVLAKLDIDGMGLQGSSLGQAAQWLHVAGHGSAAFAAAAAPMLAKIPDGLSKNSANTARIWIAAHGKTPRVNDYLAPINRSPTETL